MLVSDHHTFCSLDFFNFIAFFAHLLLAINRKNDDLLTCSINCIKLPFFIIKYCILHTIVCKKHKKIVIVYAKNHNFYAKKCESIWFSREKSQKNHEKSQKIMIFAKIALCNTVIKILIVCINHIRTQFHIF